jgi:peroxiredoxin
MMRKSALKQPVFAAGCLLALWSFNCGGRQPQSEPAAGAEPVLGSQTDSPAENTKAEPLTETPVVGDFTLKDVDGGSFTLSEHMGAEVVVLAFFATWCEPCQKELSHLDQLYTKYKDRGLLMAAVSMDLPDTVGEVRPLVKRLGLSFPVLLDDGLQATDLFNPKKNAPFSVVIDRNKNIIWSHQGYVPGDEEKLKAVVMQALGDGVNAPTVPKTGRGISDAKAD